MSATSIRAAEEMEELDRATTQEEIEQIIRKYHPQPQES
jgi:hypothetical protein